MAVLITVNEHSQQAFFINRFRTFYKGHSSGLVYYQSFLFSSCTMDFIVYRLLHPVMPFTFASAFKLRLNGDKMSVTAIISFAF